MNFIDVGSNGNGTLVVDGLGSSASTAHDTLASSWGVSGSTANVTFSNNAIGTFLGEIEMAANSTAGTTANVNILSGADLNVGNLTLATNGGTTTSATLNVNGAGATITQSGASTLTIGHPSTGVAAINIGTAISGGVFTTGSGLSTINKTGTVTVGNGANTGSLIANGNITINTGLLQIGGGSSVTVAPSKSMTLVNGGTLKGSGNITGSVVNTSGVVEPGNSPGTLSITGNYTQSVAGQVHIELAAISTFDTLVVSDFVSLAGALRVDLLGGFLPQPGNVFKFISSFSGVSGAFGNATLPILSGAAWQLRYNTNSVMLQVALLGDYNFNGIVDTADYVVWRQTLNQIGAGLAADGNGNGVVDVGDFNVWRSHVGQTAGTGSSSNELAAVPESATLVLVLIGGITVSCRGRSPRRKPPSHDAY